MRHFTYENLEKHFTAPRRISPFYDDNIKLPRKLKKKVKSGLYFKGITNGQMLWCYMGVCNSDYKSFLIKEICKKVVYSHLN